MSNRLRNWWGQVLSTGFLTVRNAGMFIGILALVFGILGYQTRHQGRFDARDLVEDFYANISTELASIAITVLVIDKLIQLRDSEKELKRLKRLMRSRTNSMATSAAGILRARGWLFDGSLEGINLNGADLRNAAMYDANIPRVSFIGTNLQEIDLARADLSGSNCSNANLDQAKLFDAVIQNSTLENTTFRNADMNGADLSNSDLTRTNFEGARLHHCNFRDACLRDANLQETHLNGVNFDGADLSGTNLYKVVYVNPSRLGRASKLRGATMPDGTRYDGRFSLAGDIRDAQAEGINIENPTTMARFYGVAA